MRLNSLQLTNFRQHADTHIDFEPGLTGIIGPNGAGKSTVLEAIAWALYGQSAVRGTRDSIRNLRAGPRQPVRVVLDFEIGGHRYRVVRGLSTAELHLDGAVVATTITDVAGKLGRVLGMTRAEFFHTYFTGQKELSVMAAMSPTERAQFLSRVLGYDRIRSAQAHGRERRKTLTHEVTGVKAGMPDSAVVESMVSEAATRQKDAGRRRAVATRAHQKAASALATLVPQWEAAQRAREALQQLQADLRLAEQGVAGLAREAERVAREWDGVVEARTALEAIAAELAPLNELHDEYQQLDGLAREEGRRKVLADALRTLSDELATLRARHVTLGASASVVDGHAALLRERTTELEAFTASYEQRRTEWVRDREQALTRRDELRKQLKDVKAHRERIVDLGEHGICPTCQRLLGEHYRTVHDGLDEQIETIIVDGKYFTTRVEQLDAQEGEFRALDERRRAMSQQVQELERTLATARAASQELAMVVRELSAKEKRHEELAGALGAIPTGFDAKRYAELERERARIGPLNEQVVRLTARIDREASLRDERERVGRQLADARDRVSSLQVRYEDSRKSEDEYVTRKQQHEAAVGVMQRAELELQASILDEGSAREAGAMAERTRQELERARERLAKLETERRVHEELDHAYSDLRTELNLQLRPELSDIAGGYLDVLTDGRYFEVEVDDEYNVTLQEDGIAKPILSGGEEDLLNLVLRLAISQMIAERSGQTFSLLILDEIFGSLDEDRRLRVVSLLRRLLGRFEQIIVLTHVAETRDDMDHKINIQRDDRTGHSVLRTEDRDLVPDYHDVRAEMQAAGAET